MDNPARLASHSLDELPTSSSSFDGLALNFPWNDPSSDLSLPASWAIASAPFVESGRDAVTSNISPSHATQLQDTASQMAANDSAAGDIGPSSHPDLGQLPPAAAHYIQTTHSDYSWMESHMSDVVSALNNTMGWMPPSATVTSGPPHLCSAPGPDHGPLGEDVPPDVAFGHAIMGFDLTDGFPFSFSMAPHAVSDALPQPSIHGLASPPDALSYVKPDPGWLQGSQEPDVGGIPPQTEAPPVRYSPTPTPAPNKRRRASGSPTAPARPGSRGQKAAKTSVSLEIIMVQPNPGVVEVSRKRPAPDAAASRTLKKISCEDANGEVHGAMITLGFGQPEHHRSRFSPEKRAETNLARREGVCSRCQGSKRKCDLALKDSPYVSCTRCSTSKLYKGMSPMPCFRSILKDIMFFRAGPAANEPLFTNRFKRLAIDDISKPNVPVRDIHLTQRVGRHKLTVYASEFVPLPHDKVSLKWKNKDGTLKEMRMPTFCLTNMQKVTAQVEQYIYEAKRSYLEDLLGGEELVSMTVKMAMAYSRARTNSLVGMALDLWAISRMIEIEWEMCGPDTLGVQRFCDPLNPRNGRIPIPPMMDTQLDQIVIQNVLNPLRKQLLDQLEARIAPFKREDWFDIYLTSFIVLNHIERVAKHSAYHAELHCMSTKFSNVPFLVSVFHSAKVVLSRFHFVCNGSAPLRLDWDSPGSASLAKLDPDQTAFMKRTQALIRAREMNLMQLRTQYDYGQSLYWSSQLFTPNWDNSPAEVKGIEAAPPVRVIEVG